MHTAGLYLYYRTVPSPTDTATLRDSIRAKKAWSAHQEGVVGNLAYCTYSLYLLPIVVSDNWSYLNQDVWPRAREHRKPMWNSQWCLADPSSHGNMVSFGVVWSFNSNWVALEVSQCHFFAYIVGKSSEFCFSIFLKIHIKMPFGMTVMKFKKICKKVLW
jgi:hypothetical protein